MPAELGSLIPPIRRARGYRLYDHRGRRYLDLWQNGGGSLLGHRGLHLMAVLKDLMSRGLLGDLPALQEGYLARALAACLPGYPWVRLARGGQEALALAARFLGRELPAEEVYDPALEPPRRAQAARWRPLLAYPPPGPERPRVLLPVLPFAASGGFPGFRAAVPGAAGRGGPQPPRPGPPPAAGVVPR
jgi:hypothetical protein